MTLVLELPEETERQLRALAQRHGLELGEYLIKMTLEQIQRDEEHRLRLEALQEMTRINEELGLYEEDNFSPAQEAELARRLKAYGNDGDAGRSWSQVRADT